jgi:hypothetical protein
MTMIERVARAMTEDFVNDQLDNIEINPRRYADDNWKSYASMARAAIEAMREPTDEMVDAGRIARMNVAGGYDGPSGWEAMIDAALKETA